MGEREQGVGAQGVCVRPFTFSRKSIFLYNANLKVSFVKIFITSCPTMVGSRLDTISSMSVSRYPPIFLDLPLATITVSPKDRGGIAEALCH